MHYGFLTAFWAILTASLIIFLTAIPISYHAAKYNIDIDLITRAAGFGYVGSTITSLIYASFSFIFFALEAAIMAQALELYFSLPLFLGYLFSSLVIIPMVFYGVTFINKLQLWTQPIWLSMMVIPFIAVILKEPEAINSFVNFTGSVSNSSEFNLYYFGSAVGISLSLIAQISEQVDYLRFMPPLEKTNRLKWWFSMLAAGPGWIILGFLKQMGGIFLAGIVLLSGLSVYEAKTPIHMYYIGYQYVFENPDIALAVATFFVLVSQIKINVTNAYAGSLAWSNFFSRVTHSHPGRVVWMMFNIAIALLLMELGLFDVLEQVLGLYSNVAIAWIGAITADLVINKPLGLSPKIIEFKRAHLYAINPVGVGSMSIASVVAIISFVGLFGEIAQSYSSLIAMFLAFVLSPLIAWYTKGKYYIARENLLTDREELSFTCEICDNEYEKEDMSYCPLHQVNICSLCCTLDSSCHDICKIEHKSTLRQNIGRWMNKLFLHKISNKASLRIFDFVFITSLVLFVIAVTIWMVYSSQISSINQEAIASLQKSFVTLFFIIAILVSVFVWWILLLQESRELAEDEIQEQGIIVEEKKKLLEKAESIAHMGSWEFNLVDNTLRWSNEIYNIFELDDKMNPSYEIFMQKIHADDREVVDNAYKKSLEDKLPYVVEHRIVMSNKKIKYVREECETQFDSEGKALVSIGVVRDITQQKIAELEILKQKDILDFQATHDALTKLPNRALFHATLAKAIHRAKRHNTKLAVFFIDLDMFKEINDTLGHAMGDRVLQEVALRLESTVRKEDDIARLGGDEFTILVDDLVRTEDASLLAKKVLQALEKPFYFDTHKLHISSSIGISLYPQDSSNLDELLMYADAAMYKAKDEGRNNFQYYASQMTKKALDKVTVELELREALLNEEFVVYYQAQIDAKDEKLTGMEALVRWNHPTKGLIPPCKFIKIAEETGLIIEIDQWVMRSAMRQVSDWYKDGLNPGVLALNLAIKHLYKEGFISFFQELIIETSCKSQWLELEVSESEIMKNPEDAIDILNQISEMGIELAVDDFGTGYSSLSYLKRLPIDKLKIDKSFVDELPHSEEDVGIAKAVIALAKSLNLNVIAEGVETKEQKDFLVENDCSNIQGYYYAKPIPADKMRQFLLK